MRTNPGQKSKLPGSKARRSRDARNKEIEKTKRKCCRCGSIGHTAPDCRAERRVDGGPRCEKAKLDDNQIVGATKANAVE